jgi:hypothetical protein
MKKVLVTTMLSLLSINALAEETRSTDEVAKELANPTSALASLNFKYQIKQFGGDLPGADDQQRKSVLFQPSMPFPLDNGDKILLSPDI